MSVCDFCEGQQGLVHWRRLEPRAGQASACESCHATLAKAAASEARSWEGLGLLEARARTEGGEVWNADKTAYWFASGGTTTPTSAKVRRVEAAFEAPVALATTWRPRP